MNIWQQLIKPIFALAPMEDVTDTVFRRIVQSCAPPDIMFTEFTNADGLNSEGYELVSQRLKFDQSEKPLIAQIWGESPESYYRSAQKIVERGFDGIDINMGCPVQKIVKKGYCSALINDHPKASEIIAATRDGAKDLPISVKTRIGFEKMVTEEWIGFLLTHKLDALIVHGRTAKELSQVPNHWEEIGKAAKLKEKISPTTILIGNGDVRSREEGIEKIKTYGLDGVMIGRAIFEDPWVFARKPLSHYTNRNLMLELFMNHIELFESTWGDTKNFAILNKFVKMYVRSFDGAAEARDILSQSGSISELKSRLNKIRHQE